MIKSFITHITALLLLAGFVGCNSSDDPEQVEYKWGDVAVTAFSLTQNDSVLANLDSVFFSIDLDRALIYNPDSLPLGTRIDKLVMSPTYGTVNKAEVKYKTAAGSDTIREYTQSDTDTLDFSRGPVILRLTSWDEKVVRDYTITVNVHKMKPDSLAWGEMAYATLPEGTACEHVVTIDDHLVFFTADASGNLSYRTTPASGGIDLSGRSTSLGALPAGADARTLNILGNELYVVASDRLMRYDSASASWSATGLSMSWIFGVYGDKLIGVDNSRRRYCSWPAGLEGDLSADFPVSETSDLFVYTSEWTSEPMALLVGGRTAAGDPTGQTWAFDGEGWHALCSNPLPAASGVMVFPYYTFRTNNQWVVTKKTALFAIGGLKADGTCQDKMYVSYDRGMHWSQLGILLQMPPYIAPRYGAQAVVVPKTMHVDGSRASEGQWHSCELPALPRWLQTELPESGSRATKPITEWECPYIYMIGGRKADGTNCTDIWRGVINRLSFVPLY